MTIKQLDSYYSELVLISKESLQVMLPRIIDQLETGEKLGLLKYLTSTMKSTESGEILTPELFITKVKDWSLFIVTVAATLIGIVQLLVSIIPHAK